jgi:heme oxygenase (mycobilin-producing)
MNMYITTGTWDYLKRIESKFPEEMMVIMVNENGALLVHETNGPSVFKEPRKYEVIDSAGQITKNGFAVLNHIPVTEEGRPLFEYEMKGKASIVKKESGFIAIRILRPLSSRTFIILTIWESEIDFQKWQNSKSFLNVHIKNGSIKGIDLQPKIFTSGSYVSIYTIPEKE